MAFEFRSGVVFEIDNLCVGSGKHTRSCVVSSRTEKFARNPVPKSCTCPDSAARKLHCKRIRNSGAYSKEYFLKMGVLK